MSEEIDIKKKILHNIRLSGTLLGVTGPLYKQIEELDNTAMVKNLGYALSYLFDIDKAICKLDPTLVADQWKLINKDKNKFENEFNALEDALEAEKKNDIKKADKLFNKIISSSLIEDNKIRAQAGLYRISILS